MVKGHLGAFLWRRIKFRSRDHLQLLQENCVDIQRRRTHNVGEALKTFIEALPTTENRRLYQCQKTGMGLSVAPSTANRTDIEVNE